MRSTPPAARGASCRRCARRWPRKRTDFDRKQSRDAGCYARCHLFTGGGAVSLTPLPPVGPLSTLAERIDHLDERLDVFGLLLRKHLYRQEDFARTCHFLAGALDRRFGGEESDPGWILIRYRHEVAVGLE